MNCADTSPTSTCLPPGKAEEELKEAFLTPAVDIAEVNDAYWLQAEMPGVQREGLQVTVEGDRLILLGRRSHPCPPGEAIHRESASGPFRRAFVLHPAIDTARIEARLENGVLTLRLPKADKGKPRRIPVTG